MTIAHADYIAAMAKGLAVLESFDTQRQRLNATLRPSAPDSPAPPRAGTC